MSDTRRGNSLFGEIRRMADEGPSDAEVIAHPVMRSIEPGEAWRWCYVDECLG